MVKYSIDILVVSKTKLDSFFPQIRIERYAPPFRYDKNSHGSGILLFLREHVPAKHLKNIYGIKFYYVVPITLIKILSQII